MIVPSPRRRALAQLALHSRTTPRALGRTVALTAVALGLALPAVASADVVTAQPASTYRDSVGVEMHSNFTGYPYDTDSIANLAAKLKFIGVDHVRDFVCLDTDAKCVRPRGRVGQLAAATPEDFLSPGSPAVKFTFGITPEMHAAKTRAARDVYIQRAFDALIAPPLAGTAEALEENNEADLEKVSNWAQLLVGDDNTIHTLLADPKYASLAALPLLTPALGRPTATPALLAAGWNTHQGEVPNFHPYAPAWGGPENGLTTPCTKTLLAFDCVKQLSTNGGAPIATESGYTTAGYGFLTGSFVSQRAQGIYEPRILMENFLQGVRRTYLYELIDLRPDNSSITNGWGLWNAKYTDWMMHLGAGAPKPAAVAISNLQARIGDLGADAVPGSLDFTLTDSTGAVIPNTKVRRLLLHRADGSYALALWQPGVVFKSQIYQQKDLNVADLNVTVTINSSIGTPWAETAFRPSADASAQQTTGDTFTVPVGADVRLIDIRGAGDGTIPGGPVVVAPNNMARITAH